jgi:hypothetical protein
VEGGYTVVGAPNDDLLAACRTFRPRLDAAAG